MIQFTKRTMYEKLILNKAINNFMIRQMKYWLPVRYGRKWYIMTFEYNVYEVERGEK